MPKEENKPKRGRPYAPKSYQLRESIPEELKERMDFVLRDRNRRKFVENALILMLDIYEGARNLPEVIPPHADGIDPEIL